MRFFYYTAASTGPVGGTYYSDGMFLSIQFPTRKQLREFAISKGAAADVFILSVSEFTESEAERYASEN